MLNLSEEQIKFIELEFGISAEEIETMDIDQWQEIREKCADIECNEATSDYNDDESYNAFREGIAADIVDIRYKQLFV